MENSEIKEYYKGEKLSIFFDARRDGYWLKVGESPSDFIDKRAYQDIERTKDNLERLDKIEAYNKMIFYKLKHNQIKSSQLEEMFSKVKEIEDKEFEEFKKANNL